MDISEEFDQLKRLIEETYHQMDVSMLNRALEKLEKIRREVGA